MATLRFRSSTEHFIEHLPVQKLVLLPFQFGPANFQLVKNHVKSLSRRRGLSIFGPRRHNTALTLATGVAAALKSSLEKSIARRRGV